MKIISQDQYQSPFPTWEKWNICESDSDHHQPQTQISQCQSTHKFWFWPLHRHFNNNSLSSQIPVELSSLTNIFHVWVFCQIMFFSLFPLFGMLYHHGGVKSGQTKFYRLLDNNNLSGDLPPQLSQLPNLQILYVCFSIVFVCLILWIIVSFMVLLSSHCRQLDNNNFSGSDIPASYGNFSSILKL